VLISYNAQRPDILRLWTSRRFYKNRGYYPVRLLGFDIAYYLVGFHKPGPRQIFARCTKVTLASFTASRLLPSSPCFSTAPVPWPGSLRKISKQFEDCNWFNLGSQTGRSKQALWHMVDRMRNPESGLLPSLLILQSVSSSSVSKLPRLLYRCIHMGESAGKVALLFLHEHTIIPSSFFRFSSSLCSLTVSCRLWPLPTWPVAHSTEESVLCNSSKGQWKKLADEDEDGWVSGIRTQDDGNHQSSRRVYRESVLC